MPHNKNSGSISLWVHKFFKRMISSSNFFGDCSDGRFGEEGSRDNKSVFQSPWSIHLDLHFVLTTSFLKKGEYKEGKLHRHMLNKFQVP